jgi:rod shape-determining protein MreD
MQLSLTNKRLDLTFVFCLFLTLAIPSLFSQIRIFFFLPFLIIACYQKNLPSVLWFGFICGLILDLLSSSVRLGIHSLTFCITLMILYPQKRNFFADSISTLPIMTLLFSIISSLVMVILLYSLEINYMLSWHWLLTDLIIMPVADTVYAFCFFTLPALIFGKPIRRGKDYFLSQ